MRQTRALFCVIRTAAFGQAAMSSTTSLDELANDWIADWRNQLETGEYGKTDANYGTPKGRFSWAIKSGLPFLVWLHKKSRSQPG